MSRVEWQVVSPSLDLHNTLPEASFNGEARAIDSIPFVGILLRDGQIVPCRKVRGLQMRSNPQWHSQQTAAFQAARQFSVIPAQPPMRDRHPAKPYRSKHGTIEDDSSFLSLARPLSNDLAGACDVLT
jgi:hypothetical protein